MENQELFVNANACAECEGSVTFENAAQKQKHYMQFHPEIQTSAKNEKRKKKADKDKACNLCTKMFTSTADLFNHQKHHRGRFHTVCTKPKCMKKFTTESDYQNHLKGCK